MPDQSYLDTKYFIDKDVYNCPFCNRRNVAYSVLDHMQFNWSDNKGCFVYLVRCNSCSKKSLHLSFTDLRLKHLGNFSGVGSLYEFQYEGDLDHEIFYSVPTSFFVMDERIPRVIRELVTEAEGCLKMNFLTGASACSRKAIYELVNIESAEGTDYESRIKFLKSKHPESDPELFDILSHIQDMTSDKIHEQSWPKWDSRNLRLILETLKIVLQDIYVTPAVKRERSQQIIQMRGEIIKEKKTITK